MTHKTPEQIARDKRARALSLPTNRKPPERKVHIAIAPRNPVIYPVWSINK